MAYDAVDYLTTQIQPGWKVFEWGSGGSTLYWLSCGAAVISVEHDREWYEIVRRQLPPDAPVEYRFIPPEPPANTDFDAEFDPSDPSRYHSNHAPLRWHTFHRYASQIDGFPERYFDLVVVDGRARPSCLVHAVSRVKAAGLLVLDNADREYYLTHTRELLAQFQLNRFVSATPTLPFESTTDVYWKGL